MKRYEFTVYLSGSGDCPAEAWENAVNKLFGNIGSFMNMLPLAKFIEVESEEEGK